MADLANYVCSERDVELALVALKKGTQLIKYGRKGKPKLCPFRVSTDETTLIWFSRGKERNLKLDVVSKIIAGQRTAVFRRYSRADKDYLSFSLLYNNCERSLDLVSKDKAEADVWFAGLKALISSGQQQRYRAENIYDGVNSIQNGQSFGATLEASLSINSRNSITTSSIDSVFQEPSLSLTRSDTGSTRTSMPVRPSNGDSIRLSVSSPLSCSHSSGLDDAESFGDVYVWGEVWGDSNLANGSLLSSSQKTNALLPRPLESNVVLDVHQIACGNRHAALVTRQGEVFTWGEEAGGRLGLGHDTDTSRPQLVESLAAYNMDFVSCGEYHTSAISMSGDLFTWGEGTFNSGLLGHGSGISHWIPKQISGHLEGLQVISVACGSWHTALTTSDGKLFTFGDGAFGALGHGNRENEPYPREVESLSGFKTVKVSCGVYHTAAIVEVTGQNDDDVISRKLFTWGDGDRYRLGHGDKESRLIPTCVSSLIDYNFIQLACGNNITVALTTSGHVFTMGSTVHGQLGNPHFDGKIPCLVQDRLVGSLVEEIACGASHVAVLTSRSEIYTWGNGANGRLGHGDIEDRETPTLVEFLKDRQVKSVACGSNFTAAICIHKWVSGADQSVCSGCHQAFGFTRKRHNCYNCGLAHCHACSSRKALKAALAPTPGKPYRVCDSCYNKLTSFQSGATSTMKRKVAARRFIDSRERSNKNGTSSSRFLLFPYTETEKFEVKSVRYGMKTENCSLVRSSQIPSPAQLKDASVPSSSGALQSALKPIVTMLPSVANARSASPYSRRPSPPRSASPVYSRSIVDNFKKTNELLNQEVLKMKAQVKNLKDMYKNQHEELRKLRDKDQETSSVPAEDLSSGAAAKELVKSLAAQLSFVTEQLSPEVYDAGTLALLHARANNFVEQTDTHCENEGDIGDICGSSLSYSTDNKSETTISHDDKDSMIVAEENYTRLEKIDDGGDAAKQNVMQEEEIVEQILPGVYVTLVQLPNGAKVFKRVRFSKKRFGEHQAKEWWRENKERVYMRYDRLDTNGSQIGSNLEAIANEDDGVNDVN